MKRQILNICLAITLMFVGYMWGHHTAPVVHAQGAKAGVPKAWGRVVGTLSNLLVLEDSTETIRIIDPDTGALIGQLNRD
jgi:hypothetical protein